MISRSEFIAVYNKYSLMTAVNIKNMILENFAGIRFHFNVLRCMILYYTTHGALAPPLASLRHVLKSTIFFQL